MKATIWKWAVFLMVVFPFDTRALAFNPPEATEGPLKVAIEAPDKVGDLGQPVAFTVSLANSSSASLDVRLEVWGVDEWRIEPGREQRIERSLKLAAGAKEQVALKLIAGAKTYNALYPIHARVTFNDRASREKRQAHAIKIFSVDAPRAAKPPQAIEPVKIGPGATSLLRLGAQRVALKLGEDGTTQSLGVGWHGSDSETGAMFEIGAADRGGRLACFSIHPPWRKGWGTIWADFDLVLPDTRPIALTFSTAIRDNTEKEPPSDGVEFKVLAVEFKNTGEAAGAPKVLFTRFTKSKTWESASVDLSPYAGKRIMLRLWSGPGPAHNTVCDSGHWGNPSIIVGNLPGPASPESRSRQQALAFADSARAGNKTDWAWQIANEAGTFGLSFVPGKNGLDDAAIAMVSEKRRLVFDGFEVQIDGTALGSIPMFYSGRWRNTFENSRAVVEATLLCGGGPTRVRAEVWAEEGALRCRFTMPDVKRDKRGNPRFTRLALGSVVEAKAQRVYAGFGNVIENPGKFDLSSNGFQLSTRHVGVDYDNGLSLVQASDVFPDRLHCDPEKGLCSLQVHHDATISLIPSEKGAFAAAKVYREGIAGFQPAPGVAKLRGRMCLDYWGGKYEHGIQAVEQLAKYGVTDCVYVWHNWQRWGYDYRLPEIYPARGDHALFLKLAETCKKHGILFCPHDNYIDFYPDAEGYSYDHIIFNEDGTPQRAWYNEGRKAQSYRWRPDSFQPWLERNIALLKRDVKPTAYFIDVFTAIEPMDYYDHTGQFHTKMETIQRWSECWDYVRKEFDGAPQISEAGSDSQIGHLDAGESDHNAVALEGSKQWSWNVKCADAERTPWHDMASHGSFVLFAGGLASRYVGGLDVKTHGYGTDDYLSLTVLGGRNPMAQGDASAETILTDWLLHDICAELGGRKINNHEFGDNNIHRQIVRFGDDAMVWVNRGKEDWKVADAILPQYGFVARAGQIQAEVTRRDGVVCGYAESPGAIFADARPPRRSLVEANTDGKIIDFGLVATNGVFRLLREKGVARIILLPGCPASEIRLRPERIMKRQINEIARIEKMNDDGTVAGQVEFKKDGDDVVFQTAAGDFGYRVAWR